jgi:ketosteroid isomerase-like protein
MYAALASWRRSDTDIEMCYCNPALVSSPSEPGGCAMGRKCLVLKLGNGLTSLQEIASLPRWPAGVGSAAKLDLLIAEEEIRDRFIAYGFAFDNCDLDGVMAFFSDDCVITNPRGRVVGAVEVRNNYAVLFDYWGTMRHIKSSAIIRFASDTDEAFLGSYHFGELVSADRAIGGIGTDIWRLRRLDGAWKIVERWITDDIDHAVVVHTGPVEDPEKIKELSAKQR